MANLSASYDPKTGILTVTLQNPPASGAPTSANVSLLGQTISVPLTDNVGTVPIAVHPSVASANIQAQVSVPGNEQTNPPIGTLFVQLGTPGGAAATLQLGAPAASGDPYNVWPTTKAQLRTYYDGLQGTIVANMASLGQKDGDLLTQDEIVSNIVMTKLLPAATAKTYTPVVLTTDEQNALADWTANIAAKQSQTLATIYPSGGARSALYATLVADVALYAEAVQAFLDGLTTIPNLT